MNRWANRNFLLALCLTLISLLSNPLAVSGYALVSDFLPQAIDAEPVSLEVTVETETPVRRDRRFSPALQIYLNPVSVAFLIPPSDLFLSLKGKVIVSTSPSRGRDVLASPASVPLRC